MIFMIPAFVFHSIFVASQSLRLKNIWQWEEMCTSSFCMVSPSLHPVRNSNEQIKSKRIYIKVRSFPSREISSVKSVVKLPLDIETCFHEWSLRMTT